MPWRLDADLYVITLDRENDDLDLVADPDALLSFPAQYEHSSFLNGRVFRGRWTAVQEPVLSNG